MESLTPEPTVYRDNLDHIAERLAGHSAPLLLPWPTPGQPGGFRSFETVAEWKACLLDLELTRSAPMIVAVKYQRAQKLFLLGWLDADIIVAGELVAFTALELALTDCYWGKIAAGRKPIEPKEGEPAKRHRVIFSQMLDYMVRKDGLTDAQVPMIARYGGGGIAERLLEDGKVRPSIAEIRNKLAHGYPFDGLPHGGLLELIRDLIGYAYRGSPDATNILSWDPNTADLAAEAWDAF